MKRTWCEALFASGLQPSDDPTAGTVVLAISRTIRQFGIGGCAGRMAQEFGDHPDMAVRRMRWVRQLMAEFDGLAERDGVRELILSRYLPAESDDSTAA